MKLRVNVNGESLLLDESAHPASIAEVTPGIFSVLLNDRSYQVNVAPHREGFEVWVGLQRFFIALADVRDQVSNSQKANAAGPVEVCAQMPGKIVKLLVGVGVKVTAGQGLIVIEAMKMQNEVKAPKDGTLTRIHVTESATVGAGDPLLIVE